MRISGNDPGFANFGWSLADHEPHARIFVAAGNEKTPADMPFDERMEIIADRILKLEADVFCMENQERNWGGRTAARGADKNSVRVREVVGMLRLRARQLGARLVVVTPQTIRSRLGLPQDASKSQVAAMVRMLVRGVPEKLSNHETDALAIGIAGARELSVPVRRARA